jgi:hypothetical protein
MSGHYRVPSPFELMVGSDRLCHFYLVTPLSHPIESVSEACPT